MSEIREGDIVWVWVSTTGPTLGVVIREVSLCPKTYGPDQSEHEILIGGEVLSLSSHRLWSTCAEAWEHPPLVIPRKGRLYRHEYIQARAAAGLPVPRAWDQAYSGLG